MLLKYLFIATLLEKYLNFPLKFEVKVKWLQWKLKFTNINHLSKKKFVVKRKNVSKICVDIPRVQKVGNCPTANFHLMVWTSSSWRRWASLPRDLIFFGSSVWYLKISFRVYLQYANFLSAANGQADLVFTSRVVLLVLGDLSLIWPQTREPVPAVFSTTVMLQVSF